MLIKISTSDDNQILILQSKLMWNNNIIILIVPFGICGSILGVAGTVLETYKIQCMDLRSLEWLCN